jgi:hypothetical protein
MPGYPRTSCSAWRTWPTSVRRQPGVWMGGATSARDSTQAAPHPQLSSSRSSHCCPGRYFGAEGASPPPSCRRHAFRLTWEGTMELVFSVPTSAPCLAATVSLRYAADSMSCCWHFKTEPDSRALVARTRRSANSMGVWRSGITKQRLPALAEGDASQKASAWTR